MENNFLGVTAFGVFHIYFSGNNVYIRKYDNNKWSRSDLVLSGATNDFDVCCTDTSLFVLCEKNCGTLILTEYTRREKKQVAILTSSRGTRSVSDIKLLHACDTLNVFYLLHHEEKKLLVHQSTPFRSTPLVIDSLGDNYFFSFADDNGSISIFFEKNGKPTKCILAKDGIRDTKCTDFLPLSHCIFEDKRYFVFRQDGHIMFGKNVENATPVTDFCTQKLISSFLYREKIYIVFTSGSSVYTYLSADGGKTFQKALPQITSGTPPIKNLNVRKNGFDISLPCNAERGYIRSIVIPMEQIINCRTRFEKENITEQISSLERKIAHLKKELETLQKEKPYA